MKQRFSLMSIGAFPCGSGFTLQILTRTSQRQFGWGLWGNCKKFFNPFLLLCYSIIQNSILQSLKRGGGIVRIFLTFLFMLPTLSFALNL
jgi:hypothetical protein